MSTGNHQLAQWNSISAAGAAPQAQLIMARCRCNYHTLKATIVAHSTFSVNHPRFANLWQLVWMTILCTKSCSCLPVMALVVTVSTWLMCWTQKKALSGVSAVTSAHLLIQTCFQRSIHPEFSFLQPCCTTEIAALLVCHKHKFWWQSVTLPGGNCPAGRKFCLEFIWERFSQVYFAVNYNDNL